LGTDNRREVLRRSAPLDGWRYVGKTFEADPSLRFGIQVSFIFCEVKTFGLTFIKAWPLTFLEFKFKKQFRNYPG
jgi:hypothetical protein